MHRIFQSWNFEESKTATSPRFVQFLLDSCLGDFIQPKNCEISNSGGNIFCKTLHPVKTFGFNVLSWPPMQGTVGEDLSQQSRPNLLWIPDIERPFRKDLLTNRMSLFHRRRSRINNIDLRDAGHQRSLMTYRGYHWLLFPKCLSETLETDYQFPSHGIGRPGGI